MRRNPAFKVRSLHRVTVSSWICGGVPGLPVWDTTTNISELTVTLMDAVSQSLSFTWDFAPSPTDS